MLDFSLLVLSSIVSEVTLLFYVLGVLKERTDLRRYGALGVKVIFGLLTTATILLVYQFLVHDFQNLYVATHSSKSLPIIAVISGTVVVFRYASRKSRIPDSEVDFSILEGSPVRKKVDLSPTIEDYDLLFQEELERVKKKK